LHLAIGGHLERRESNRKKKQRRREDLRAIVPRSTQGEPSKIVCARGEEEE